MKNEESYFMGTPEFSTGVLKRLIEDETVGSDLPLSTQPDRAVGRRKLITPTPVKGGRIGA